MHNLIKFAGLALLLGCICQNVVFAGELPRFEQPVQQADVRQPEQQKRKFTPDEDAKLCVLVAQLGIDDWTLIAQNMPGRNGKQCRARWVNGLAPEVSHAEWTPEEDNTLRQRHRQLGNQWAKIVLFLPRRTAVSVKNRWQTLLRKGMKQPQLMDSPQDVRPRLPSIDTFPFPAGNR
ncbi:MAG: hypothetical protein LBF84_03560 [Holosporales bacterium]|nr:hypothetical protein [Holosporales bacterium]